MNPTPIEHDAEVWKRLDAAYSAYRDASLAFFAEGVDRVALIREALRDGRGKFTACHLLRHLNDPELTGLFDVLVEWASTGHSLVHVFREAIISMPRDWVIEHIEQTAEPILRGGTYDEYRRLLELYSLLDRGLTERLAQRAAAHPDEDIREAGEDYAQLWKGGGPPVADRGPVVPARVTARETLPRPVADEHLVLRSGGGPVSSGTGS